MNNKICSICGPDSEFIYTIKDSVCRVCASDLTTNVNNNNNNNISNTLNNNNNNIVSTQLQELFEIIGGENLLEAIRSSLELSSPIRQIDIDYLNTLGW